MWTREGLKTNTKAMLKVHYWKIFLVLIGFGFVSGGASTVSSVFTGPMSSIGSIFSQGKDSIKNYDYSDGTYDNSDNSYDYSDDYSTDQDWSSFESEGLGFLFAIAGIFFFIFIIIYSI